MIAALRHLLLRPLLPKLWTFPPPHPTTKSDAPTTRNSRQTHRFVLEMIKTPGSTSRQGLALANNLTLVQHTSLGSGDVFLSLFSSLTEGHLTDLVLLQDPPATKGFLPSFSGFKSFAPPIARPRVACYLSQKVLQEFGVLLFFPPETDKLIALDVFSRRGGFDSKFTHFRIGNSYGRPVAPAANSVSPKSSLLDLEYPYLVAGDFNIYNSATDPCMLMSSKEQGESAPYFDRATDLGFTLLNTPGIYT